MFNNYVIGIKKLCKLNDEEDLDIMKNEILTILEEKNIDSLLEFNLDKDILNVITEKYNDKNSSDNIKNILSSVYNHICEFFTMQICYKYKKSNIDLSYDNLKDITSSISYYCNII